MFFRPLLDLVGRRSRSGSERGRSREKLSLGDWKFHLTGFLRTSVLSVAES